MCVCKCVCVCACVYTNVLPLCICGGQKAILGVSVRRVRCCFLVDILGKASSSFQDWPTPPSWEIQSHSLHSWESTLRLSCLPLQDRFRPANDRLSCLRAASHSPVPSFLTALGQLQVQAEVGLRVLQQVPRQPGGRSLSTRSPQSPPPHSLQQGHAPSSGAPHGPSAFKPW